MEIEQFETKADFLAGCVDALVRKYPRSSSYNALSKRVGITSSTLERIAKKEVESPSFDKSVKLVRSVCEDGQVKAFIEKFYPEMKEQFSRIYTGNSDLPFVPPETEDFFTNALTYEVMLFVSASENPTVQDVERKFGEKGKQILDRLLEKNAVERRDGAIVIDGPINMHQNAVHRLFVNLVNNHYDVQSFGEKESWLSLQYRMVDREKAMARICEVNRRASQEVRDILNDPEMKGDDLVWFGIIMDELFPEGSAPRKEETSEGEILQ